MAMECVLSEVGTKSLYVMQHYVQQRLKVQRNTK